MKEISFKEKKKTLNMNSSILVTQLLFFFVLVYVVKGDSEVGQLIEGQKRFLGSPPKLKRIAIGYNACLDLIVSAKDTISKLFQLEKFGGEKEDKESIRDLTDFEKTFSFWFSKGVAAERFVESSQLFQEIVSASEKTSNPVYYIGGNAALMAQVMSEAGSTVLLGGAVSHKLKSLLNENIRLPQQEIKYKTDEIHLILVCNSLH